MPEQIRDGTGTGRLLEISSEHKAQTDSVTTTEEAHIADLYGRTFVASTGILNISSTNPHVAFRLQNTDPDRNLYIAVATFGWNGGDTTGNKSAWWEYMIYPGDSTANYTVLPLGNLNLTSGQIALTDFNVWDGVGE